MIPYFKIVRRLREKYGEEVELSDFKQELGVYLHIKDSEFQQTAKEMETWNFIRKDPKTRKVRLNPFKLDW